MKDLMVRGATLEVPPPISGLEQMSKDKVAYAQIHVERAIGRMKVFSILKKIYRLHLFLLLMEFLYFVQVSLNCYPPLGGTFSVLPI